jgi:tetratricopeptide (TPR) repeat protein
MTQPTLPTVFLSYSHKDEEWRHILRPHLQQLENASLIRYWDDRMIDGGEEWYDTLKTAIDDASVAVCLISTNYLSSTFCQKEEVPYLLERRQHRQLAVVPVLLDDCKWKYFPWIEAAQMLPRDSKYLLGLSAAERSEALSYVADCIIRNVSGSAAKATAPVANAVKRLDRSRLPETAAEVFGRDAELRLLDEAWSSKTVNVVALTGAGGVGKSALVNRWLSRMSSDGYRGACNVLGWSFFNQGSGQRFTGADEFVHFALAWLGDAEPENGSPWDQGARLARLLRQERSLLILDGLEALQSGRGEIRDPAISTLVKQFLGEHGSLCIVTSRVHVPDATGLNGKSIDLEALSPDAGRALLRVSGVRGTDEMLRRAATEFGSHALGVKLLSAYVSHTGKGIEDALAIPDIDVTGNEGRHARRVMSALATLLGSGPEMDLLHVVSLFDRPADAGALRALRTAPAIPGLTAHLVSVSDDQWPHLLQRLRALSLLAPENPHDPAAVDTHPLIREHFGRALRRGSRSAWESGHDRLYQYLIRLAPDLPETIEEMAPLFQGIGHGCAAGNFVDAWRDVFRRRIQRGWDFYGTRRLRAWGEHLSVLVNFVERLWDKPAAALAVDDQAFVLYQAGVCLRALGDFASATDAFRTSLDLALSNANWAGAAAAASNLSETELLSGDLERSLVRARQGVVFADQCGEPYQQSGKRTTLADALHQLGRLTEAQQAFEDASAVTRPDGTPEPMSQFGLYRWCELRLTRRQYADAAEMARRCLATPDSNPLYVALHELMLGLALLRGSAPMALPSEAAVLIDGALNGLRQAGNADMTPKGLLARAELRARQGKLDQANGDVEEAAVLAERARMPLLVVDAQLARASIFASTGRRAEAHALVAKIQQEMTRRGYARPHHDLSELQERLALLDR